VSQPVVWSGAPIHGKGLSGGTVNRGQKPVRVPGSHIAFCWKIALVPFGF